MVDSLNTLEVGKILNELMGGTATILEKSFVQIYTADGGGKHHYHGSNITGICCIVFDRREGKCAYLRVYDSASLQLLFSMELYYGFKDCWTELMPNFYTAPFFDGFIGFLFPNAQEAIKIKNKINSMAPKIEDYEKLKKEQKQREDDKAKEIKHEKESKTFIGKAKGFFGSSKEEKKDVVIGGPTGFKHESSMKFNQATGEVDLENLPEEYRAILKNAGISKKELQDKQYAGAIFMAIANFNEDPNTLNSKKAVEEQAKQNVGIPPPPPPPPPPTNKSDPTSQTTQQQPKKQVAAPSNLLAEIQAGKQLKSVQVSKQEAEIKLKDLDKNQQENLSDYLGRMMAERRAQLNKNKKESSGSDGNWSDD